MAVSSPALQTEGPGQLVTGTAQDNAGNAATDPVLINIDETRPTISASVLPAANPAGWNNTAVNVSFTCSDPNNASNGTAGSGIVSCTAPKTVATAGSGQSVSGSTTDAAGNSASVAPNINIDTTPPAITFFNQTPAPNANGWNNTSPTITWNCADSLSGATTPNVSSSLSSEGANQSVSGACNDRAGNSSSATRTGINVDRTAPTLAPSVSSNSVLLGGTASASANATDALSGIAAQSCGSFDTSSVGMHTVSCTATDKAGNTATRSVSYTVVYGQKLLYNTSTSYKSGANLAIALQLQNAAARNVSSASIPVTAVEVVNSSGSVVRTINAAFTFSKGQAQYAFSLETRGLASGTYSLRFTAGGDPTTHLAPFSIR
jgi:hypothetical protein